MINPAEAERLLVIKPSSLGDVVHTLPAVAALHRAFGHLGLQWVVNTEWAPLLQNNPALSGVIEFPRREFRGWRDLFKARKWARKNLRPLKPDIALDFQGLLRSALLAKASRARQIAGFENAREGASWFYRDKIAVPDWDRLHAVDRYFRLVESIGVPHPDVVEFTLPEGEPMDGVTVPEGSVLLHPFSRGNGKSLSFEEAASFCRHLGDRPVFLAGAGVKWPEHVKLPPNATNLIDRTSLAQLIRLIRRAAWIVSVDSGPMHLAAAITHRLLSIHTWTDPLMVGPYRKRAWIWRDGFIEKISAIEPGRFPERRELRSRPVKSILPPGGAGRLAEFVEARLSESSAD